jgi:hypothetical protein
MQSISYFRRHGGGLKVSRSTPASWKEGGCRLPDRIHMVSLERAFTNKVDRDSVMTLDLRAWFDAR